MPEKLARFRVNDKPVNGAMSPQQPQDIPCGMEIAKNSGWNSAVARRVIVGLTSIFAQQPH
jgi:hypothetical protein